MSSELITVLVSLGSLTLGWLLNELSSYFKTRKQEKSSLNEVLYFQLQIWNLIIKTNIEFIIKGLKQLLKEKGIENHEDLKMIDYIFKSFVESTLVEMFSKSIEDIHQNYNAKIENLSKHYPIIAYRISDKNIVHNYLNTLDGYFKKVSDSLKNDNILSEEPESKYTPSTNKEAMDLLRETLKPYLHAQAKESIEEDLLLVARKLSLFDFWQIKRRVKNRSLDEFLDEYLDQIDHFFQLIDESQ